MDRSSGHKYSAIWFFIYSVIRFRSNGLDSSTMQIYKVEFAVAKYCQENIEHYTPADMYTLEDSK